MSAAPDAGRRFRDAHERVLARWAAADPSSRAAAAGCGLVPAGVVVPFFGRPHLVTHPAGDVTADGVPVHVAVAITLLHYLLRADGTPQEGRWVAFRDLPDGLFYAASFAARAEAPIACAFAEGAPTAASGLQRFREAAAKVGRPLEMADAAFVVDALPRVAVAVLFWAGDDEYPAEARLLFDADARHYLPAEDLAGLGGQLACRLAATT